MLIFERLNALNITLPELTPPVAAFVPFLRDGNLLFLSGHIAKIDGKPWVGQLGDLTTAQGKKAARGVAIDPLHAAVGQLARVKRIAKLMVLVNSTPTFTEQRLVANGASELFEQASGEVGKHVRSAFGVAQLPFGSCVEIDLVAEVRD